MACLLRKDRDRIDRTFGLSSSCNAAAEVSGKSINQWATETFEKAVGV